MKIKNCPFCGGEAKLWSNELEYRLYGVFCKECDCMTPYFTTSEEAIETWNRREPINETIAELESRFMAEENRFRMGVYLDVIEIVKGGTE